MSEKAFAKLGMMIRGEWKNSFQRKGRQMSKIRAFLDTSALLHVLSEEGAPDLFASTMLDRVTYVIDEIVFQELVLFSATQEQPVPVAQVEKVVEVLPFHFPVTGATAAAVQRLRSLALHSNDVLVVSSAMEANCEYFITCDQDISNAASEVAFEIVTPEEFVGIVEEHETSSGACRE